MTPPATEIARDLPWAQWLPQQRWYAGRTKTLRSVTERAVLPLCEGLELTLIDVRYADTSSDRYQVAVQWDSAPPLEARSSATIGTSADHTAYDALHHPDAACALLDMVGAGRPRGAVRFDREPDARIVPAAEPRVINAEQSNTSVVFSEQSVLKLFRRVASGVNPDVELNRVLSRVGNPHIAPLLGTVETTLDGQCWPLGMVTEFAADSVNGWDIASASVRDRSARGAQEWRRLGQAVASVHTALADELGVSSAEFPAAQMRARLDAAVTAVPALAPYHRAIADRYDELDGRAVTVQRVHGDLHLGQVLRTPQTWVLIDFEGEPGRPAAQRRLPDSPLRDVAGMLRSFSYAASRSLADSVVDRQVAAFCDGYTDESGADPRTDADVLSCYELDKAVYEAAYEAAHRPGWLHIPMDSIARIVG